MKLINILIPVVIGLPLAVTAGQDCRTTVQLKTEFKPPAPKFHFDTQSKRLVINATSSLPTNRLITTTLFKILKLDPLNKAVDQLQSDTRDIPYFQKLAEAFQLKVSLNDEVTKSLSRIPKTGPVMVVMNHPLNGSEAIAVLSEITKIRPDIKGLFTYFLNGLPGVQDAAYFLNPYGTKEGRTHNEYVMNQQIIPHLQNEGAILIFPSGEVSMKQNMWDQPTEKLWKKGVTVATQAVPKTQILPIFISDEASQNWYRVRKTAELSRTGKSWIEKTFGKLAWSVAPLVHLKEIAGNIGRSLNIGIGFSIESEQWIQRFSNDRNLNTANAMNYLRSLTFSMRDRLQKVSIKRDLQEIWSPEDLPAHLEQVSKNLLELDPQPLAVRGGVDVYSISHTDISLPLFQELGRLREIVFRTVGEGSGLSKDLDSNDPFYHHFIAHDSKSKRILGSYRMGRLDELNKINKPGYNESFFTYSSELISQLNKQGLEFGRSFVDKESGKKALIAFFGLWNGIGKFISEHAHYRYMVGPVSISNEYSVTAKKIMVGYLMKFHAHPETLAKAKVPFDSTLNEYEKNLLSSIHNLKDLNDTVKNLDGKEVPPLLGIYSQLRGRYLAFSIDKDFNTVDGMILVDMHEMLKDPELQKEYSKYMTEEGVRKYIDSQTPEEIN